MQLLANSILAIISMSAFVYLFPMEWCQPYAHCGLIMCPLLRVKQFNMCNDVLVNSSTAAANADVSSYKVRPTLPLVVNVCFRLTAT